MERPISKPAAQSSTGEDRRINPRHDGAGLQVEIEGRVYPVLNVSTGGLCLVGLDRKVGDRFRFVMSRVGEVEGVTGEAEILLIKSSLFHLTFTRPTMPLLRLVITHVSALTGVVPHLLKNN